VPSVVQYPLTLLAFDGTPKNVRIATALAATVTTTPVVNRAFIINAPRTVPTPPNVLIGVQYGNNGTEFTGTHVEAGGSGAFRVIGSAVVRRIAQ
jgi:hypothetical protein